MALPHEIIESKRVSRIGPYSQAVRVGNLIFVAGQAGIDPISGQIVDPDFAIQVRQAFSNLRAILEDAGSGLHRVVKVTCYLAEPNGFAILNTLFEEHFPDSPPTRATPIVRLPGGLLFSIEAIASAE